MPDQQRTIDLSGEATLITTSSDADIFAGQLVAYYVAEVDYFFARYPDDIRSPIDSEARIGYVSQRIDGVQEHLPDGSTREVNARQLVRFGTVERGSTNQYLVDTKLQNGVELKIRTLTEREVEFVRLQLTRGAQFGYADGLPTV